MRLEGEGIPLDVPGEQDGELCKMREGEGAQTPRRSTQMRTMRVSSWRETNRPTGKHHMISDTILVNGAPHVSGEFDAIPNEAYHAAPALGSSGAWKLYDECPALYWYESPSNPSFQRVNKREFDIGTAAHLIILEPQILRERTVIVDAADYKTKEARAGRDAAYTAGKTPLLPHELALVCAMRDSLWSHPVAKHAFIGGVTERSYFWRDPATQVWCKARPDFTPSHRRYLPDLKTSTTANPEAFARHVADFGYHMREAFYMEGMRQITGDAPEKACFVVISKKPPHLVSVCWLDDEALAWGRVVARKATDIYARCLERGEWPGYRLPDALDKDQAFTISLPVWTRKGLEERRERGDFIVTGGATP